MPKTKLPSLSEALNEALDSKRPKRASVAGLGFPDDESETPVTPVTDVTPVTTVTPVTRDAAPRRDFTRTANSIVREAVPAGVFTGKGKQLYDYLYSRTRGAIVPKMSARIPTAEVMRGAGMTRHPFRAHIHRLVSFGLVRVEERGGGHGGNVYTVFLPEEVDPGHRGDGGHTGDKVPVVQGSQGHGGDGGSSPDFQRTSGESKTLRQRPESDDDEFPRLRAAAKEITGREARDWHELDEILATELRIAAGRTTVSSVPAFLAEHLRRRLWKKDKRQLDAERGSEGDSEPAKAITGDFSKCPSCFGTGLEYPNGYDKGVRRCTHPALRPALSPG